MMIGDFNLSINYLLFCKIVLGVEEFPNWNFIFKSKMAKLSKKRNGKFVFFCSTLKVKQIKTIK